ncbi:hypothetical protein [Streptomyces sp. PRh5]|uniref:hypothetical protein n=1 Tax=Streptomyces sp. PRh5 TaxID=1158056 RepID=UPI0004B95A2F|nr:hypothetical protein [Streptomyces sp. PRh5]
MMQRLHADGHADDSCPQLRYGPFSKNSVRAHQHAAAPGRKGGSITRTNGTITPSADPDDNWLITEIHRACDGAGRPLVILLTPGQRHDSICARRLLERIRVPRTGLGRPRCKPDHVVASKAYSSRGFRAYLRNAA